MGEILVWINQNFIKHKAMKYNRKNQIELTQKFKCLLFKIFFWENEKANYKMKTFEIPKCNKGSVYRIHGSSKPKEVTFKDKQRTK